MDLLFTGDAWRDIEVNEYEQILHGLGGRPLGLEVAQLIEITRWIQARAKAPKVRLETSGIRNQVVSLIATALEPNLFSEVLIRDGMPSLSYLLEKPVTFQEAADLFCPDLYKEFDLDRLIAIAAPAKVTSERNLKIAKQ